MSTAEAIPAAEAQGAAEAPRVADQSGGPRHAPPFHCPYCGEEDIRPHGEDVGQWRCAACTRVWVLRFVGLAPTPSFAEVG